MKHWITGAAAALVVGLSPVASAAETMRVTLQLPETHSVVHNWKDFQALVEEESGGELKLNLFPAAQLFKDKEIPGAVGTGAVEAGSVFIGRYAGAVPAVDVISIPFIFDGESHIRAAVAPGSELRTMMDAAILKETNNRVLWWQAFGRNIYLNNDSAIVQPSDMAEQKVRTYGKVQGWTIQALGGAPTLMSGSKQFLAYQQGAVDVGMTGVSSVKTRSLYEVMDHMTLTFDSAIEFVAVINNDFYESLSDEHKAIINAAAAEVEQKLRDQIYAEEASIVEEMKAKMTVVELSVEQRADWVEATAGVVDRFVEETGETGAAAVAAVKAAMTN
ncbi:TRAP transporter substrate-binding protein DctP [Oricola sp.]|uniref:TRAP transporter substrate-binding protein DctP n=1 Tax=Oricola sp. TaxID=1979950 RepID=UPI003BAAD910